MDAWHQDARATIYNGDCLEVLRELPDASVDAVVTDPPYGINFMGKAWDGAAIAQAAVSGVDHTKTRERSASMHAGSYDLSLTGNRAFQAWAEDWAVECLRVLKPGGHLLAFGGTRTWHRLACAIEDAGFEVRDSIAWMYGSGFPKSLDVSKAIDKSTGENRQRQLRFTAWMRSTGLPQAKCAAIIRGFAKNDATAAAMAQHYYSDKQQPSIPTLEIFNAIRPYVANVPEAIERLVVERTGIEWTAYKNREVLGERDVPVGHAFAGDTYGGDSSSQVVPITAPATDAAREWSGWGTALKPAHEPIVVARKPLVGTVAANVLEHGTGALNIDGCRIPSDDGFEKAWDKPVKTNIGAADYVNPDRGAHVVDLSANRPVGGRWPANVVLDEDQAAELDQQSGVSTAGKPRADRGTGGIWSQSSGVPCGPQHGDSGGASRFFYVAKAPARERPKVDGTAHPTVKPLTLMRWLCRLVTPPDGVILEPFAGSGTTIEAALMEGFRVVGIEREADYLPLIQARLDRVAAQEPENEQLTLDASA